MINQQAIKADFEKTINHLPCETVTASFNSEKARELFEKLEPLLKRGSPECLEMIDDLHCIPGSGKLIKQIDEFYFLAAKKTFLELREKLLAVPGC